MQKGQHSQSEIDILKEKVANLEKLTPLSLQTQQQIQQYQNIINQYERTNRL